MTEPASVDPTDSPVLAAAILDDGSVDCDALLATIVQQLRRDGHEVRGLLMTYPEGRDGCAGAMVLVDIGNGRTYRVSQDLGAGSNACRADAQGFAQASQVLREALRARPDLVVSNRFGGLEADGGGFADELLQVMAQGLPLLTVVPTRHVSAWQRFTGDAPVLPAQGLAVAEWLARALGAARAAPC